jgi:hypothetical protein
VAGKVPPEIEKPDPEIESELIVKGAVPLEDTVTDCDTAVPTATLPNVSEAALRLIPGVPVVAGDSVMLNVFATRPALAVMVAVCAVLTPITVALNPVLVVPAFTVMLAGTVTAALLLFKFTVTLRLVFEAR